MVAQRDSDHLRLSSTLRETFRESVKRFWPNFIGDDNSYRPFSSAAARGTGYGKYGRNTRNFFNPRGGGGGSYWGDHADTFPLPKQQHDLSGQSLVNDLLTYQSHPSSDIDTSSWDHVSFKDQNDKLPAHRGDKQQFLRMLNRDSPSYGCSCVTMMCN